ncbi:MAG: DNA alkylation repair protein [Marinilabiliales bacterium]|nr:DNA alkylation repair protein [Marinilabiliales bacterium]
MEYLLDDPASEKTYQEILRRLRPLQNGEVADAMRQRGVVYKLNLGASVISLRTLAASYEKNHLLALKLWNKQWRETMILATLLEQPEKVTASQMDFWVKQIQHIEMAEQAAMNLFSLTPLAFEKAVAYCLSKKSLIKMTGLLMMGRLALIDKTTGNEQFEQFLELFPPMAKDAQLTLIFRRVFIQIAMRNEDLYTVALQQARLLLTHDNEVATSTARELIEHLECDAVRDLVASRS